MQLTTKQLKALDLLTGPDVTCVGYGGAAGGGKSILGSYWLTLMCEVLPGSKWFVGRDSLKDTRESVLFTFRKVAKELKRKEWRYADNHIYFNNGSEIEFLDLSYYPQKDPMYERLGSKEYTGGWIEEAGNVHSMAYEVLKTRVGRWYNTEFKIKGKILVTFNPKKNWLYQVFYLPFKKKEEQPHTKFIPALAVDNPYLTEDYIKTLHTLKDKATKERLLYGNFDYDDDPTALISFQSITNLFTNTHVVEDYKKKYIISDIARFGSDKAVITIWHGFTLTEYYMFDTSSTVQIQECINALRKKHQIPASNVLADEDGVGGGVVDNCGIVGFKNGGKPSNKTYFNRKCECGYKLAEIIDKMYFKADVGMELRQRIEEELGQLKTYQADKDGRLRILPKEKIKETLGRSPDWLDVFIMRAWYELDDGDIEQEETNLYHALYN